jgi:hypothetical protein
MARISELAKRAPAGEERSVSDATRPSEQTWERERVSRRGRRRKMAGAGGREEGVRAGRRDVGRVRKEMEPLKGCRECSAQMSKTFRLTVTHRQGGRAGTGLGLDDFCGVSARSSRSHSNESVPTVTAELDALHEVLVLLSLDVLALGGLAEERNDGDARVAADDGDLDVLGVGVFDLAEEARGTDDVEGGDTEEAERANERSERARAGEREKGGGKRASEGQTKGEGKGAGEDRAKARGKRESVREWSGGKAGQKTRRRNEDEYEDSAIEADETHRRM